MPRNEDGEFEVLLGTRQLLSGFFIIVVLFGVLFAMGYIVGRHSAPENLAASTPQQQEASPIPAASATGPAPGEAQLVTEAVKTEPAAVESAPTPATQPAAAPPESPQPVTAGRTEPNPGRYLQVAAPRRTAAGGVVESLKNKGIAAVLAPGPDAETVRVLVGPLDPANVGKVRGDLESAGFKPFIKNY